MFTLAFTIGIYGYILTLLGFAGVLYKTVIVIFTVIYILLILLWKIRTIKSIQWREYLFLGDDKYISYTLAIYIVGQTVVNLLGALSPELAFDSLWYHLTLPKIFLANHHITHMGGLLYYSDMPKLIEMLYIAALSFGNEITAKLIHFSFGMLTLIAVYKITKQQLNAKAGLLAVAILSGNLVFAWESTTAYIDLGRTFFETMALWGFLHWIETKQRKWLTATALLIGFAIASKVLAIISLTIVLILWHIVHRVLSSTRYPLYATSLQIILLALLIPFPWFLFSFIHTGNPFYPFFSKALAMSPTLPSLTTLLYSSDPISPIYLIMAPLIIINFKKMEKGLKLITLYSGLAVIFWLITPQIGGGRFILPYLPALSIISAVIIVQLKGDHKRQYLYNLMICTLLLISASTIIYRAAAEKKYLPVLFGKESKAHFLANNLNFEFSDFYDIDGYFASHIKPADKVVLYGFHNLYYVNFPFIDHSWLKRGDTYNYIATQNTTLPQHFVKWHLVYQNPKTHVKLYKQIKP